MKFILIVTQVSQLLNASDAIIKYNSYRLCWANLPRTRSFFMWLHLQERVLLREWICEKWPRKMRSITWLSPSWRVIIWNHIKILLFKNKNFITITKDFVWTSFFGNTSRWEVIKFLLQNKIAWKPPKQSPKKTVERKRERENEKGKS